MINLSIEIELNGISVPVGKIAGTDYTNAKFYYLDDYCNARESMPISISLPLQREPFSAESTKIFFEGLLPEGFIRKCVAKEIHANENDYLALLALLGNECLGAIRVVDETTEKASPAYVELTDDKVKALAQEGATESVQLVTKAHLSLTGASGKVGLYYDKKQNKWFFPVGDAPSTHIVKQSHIRLKKIVTNEQLCLLTAKNLGIDIPESFIVNVGSDNKEDVLFATKRYDRLIDENSRFLNGLPVPYRLHQEDLAQALGIAATDKYESNEECYLKRVMQILRAYSTDPITDQFKLWDICIFNYLVGNTDNHIKNLSIVYGKDLRSIRLSPAYDIVSTMIYESSTDKMAMSIGGLYSIYDIGREDFEREALNIGFGRKNAVKRFDYMVANFEEALLMASKELLAQGFEEVEEIRERILLKGGIVKYRSK